MERKSSTSAAGQRRGLGETLNEVENFDDFTGRSI